MPITQSIEWISAAITKRPIRVIAAEIGVSDVALGKYCKQHNIKVFDSNHWHRNSEDTIPGVCPKCGSERILRRYNSAKRGNVISKHCKVCSAKRQVDIRDKRELRGQCITCGNNSIKKYCDKCNRVNLDNRILRNRDRKISAIESFGGKCEGCKGVFPYYVYDFHHKENKSYSMGKLFGLGTMEKILFELKKCKLLCVVCHRLEHGIQGDWTNEIVENKDSLEYRRYFIWKMKECLCYDCGKSYRPWAMDFDHRNPEIKKFKVSDAINNKCSMKELEDEISKCDVVCANCHRVRTFLRHNGAVAE